MNVCKTLNSQKRDYLQHFIIYSPNVTGSTTSPRFQQTHKTTNIEMAEEVRKERRTKFPENEASYSVRACSFVSRVVCSSQTEFL